MRAHSKFRINSHNSSLDLCARNPACPTTSPNYSSLSSNFPPPPRRTPSPERHGLAQSRNSPVLRPNRRRNRGRWPVLQPLDVFRPYWWGYHSRIPSCWYMRSCGSCISRDCKDKCRQHLKRTYHLIEGSGIMRSLPLAWRRQRRSPSILHCIHRCRRPENSRWYVARRGPPVFHGRGKKIRCRPLQQMHNKNHRILGP